MADEQDHLPDQPPPPAVPPANSAAKKAPAKKAAAKKAPVKKAAAKKVPAKKTAAKTPAKKTPAKKAPAEVEEAPVTITPVARNGSVPITDGAREAAAQAKSTIDRAKDTVAPASLIPVPDRGRRSLPMTIAIALTLLAIVFIRQLRRGLGDD